MVYKNKSIALMFIFISIIFLLLVNGMEFYIKFQFQFNIMTIFYAVAAVWLRAIWILWTMNFWFLIFNIYIRYRLVNERFR